MERPFFIVGAPRSGSTLLRLMLDGHPRLAIPGEAAFLPAALKAGLDKGALLERIIADRWFRDWGLAESDVRIAARRAWPDDAPALVRAVFEAYAAARGKARWGDKTPNHARHVTRIAAAFPDAQFIHLVRDGRDVAASIASKGWRSPVGGAFWWRRNVSAAVAGGRTLGAARYLELRLEDLVADSEASLRRLCAFLGEEYVPELLDHASRVDSRLTLWERHVHDAERLRMPPTPGLRDWRTDLTRRDASLVEAVCRPWLARFGYRVPPRRPIAAARAWATVAGNARAHALAAWRPSQGRVPGD